MDCPPLPALVLSDRLVDLARANASSVHPRLVQLLERRRAIGRDYFAVVDGDPGYLTDLRMKRYDEAETYFLDNVTRLASCRGADNALLKEPARADACVATVRHMLRLRDPAGAVPRYDFGRWLEDAVRERPDVIGHVLCFYVNSLGSWDDANAIALEVFGLRDRVRRDEDGALLLILCGYACAIAEGDERARVMYDAGVLGLRRAFDRFFVHMRMATAELKRFNDHVRFETALARADNDASLLVHEGHTAEDAWFVRALVLNLRALAHLRRGDMREAAAHVGEAATYMRSLPAERLTLPPSVAGRYRFMVIQNLGLLHGRRGEWGVAAGHFRDAVQLARNADPASVSEGLAVLGFALLRLRSPASARVCLEEAERLLAHDARPKSLENVRALLAVACADADDERSAATWLALAKPTVKSRDVV